MLDKINKEELFRLLDARSEAWAKWEYDELPEGVDEALEIEEQIRQLTGGLEPWGMADPRLKAILQLK